MLDDDVHSKMNTVLGCLQKRMIINKLGLLSLLLGRLSGFNLQLLHSRTQIKWRVNTSFNVFIGAWLVIQNAHVM